MRPIKFRLRDAHNVIVGYEEWSTGFIDKAINPYDYVAAPRYLYSADGEYGNPKKIPHRYKDQFTGLLDKRKIEIYENDIVKCPITDQSADYLLLEAGDKDYVIRTISIPECYQEGLPDNCEILGNIFEHPELIKEQP